MNWEERKLEKLFPPQGQASREEGLVTGRWGQKPTAT